VPPPGHGTSERLLFQSTARARLSVALSQCYDSVQLMLLDMPGTDRELARSQ
jgi:hypothetical protein